MSTIINKVVKSSNGGGTTRQMEMNITPSVGNVSNPPTDAELDSLFGTPAVVGVGYFNFIDDNDADTAVYMVYSTGTSWWITTMTKAV